MIWAITLPLSLDPTSSVPTLIITTQPSPNCILTLALQRSHFAASKGVGIGDDASIL